MNLELKQLKFTVRAPEEEIDLEQLPTMAINLGYSIKVTKDAPEGNSAQLVELTFNAAGADAVVAIDGALDILASLQTGMTREKLVAEAYRRRRERLSSPTAD